MAKQQLAGLFGIVTLTTLGLWLWLTPPLLTLPEDISFKIIDGREIALTDLRGRPVVVTFWATTCSTCLQEMPQLMAMYKELAPKGLEVIGIAMPYDPPNRVLQMSQKKEIPYPIALDIDGKITHSFGDVSVTPTVFLIAPDGKIVLYETGKMNMNKLREQITNLLS